MPTRRHSRDARVATLIARMPNVPRDVAALAAAAAVDGRFTSRGGPAALERFYGHMLKTRRAPQQVRLEDFAAVTTSRTGLITLMNALAAFDPGVPLAPARPLRQDWDRWLNARYNAKEARPRVSQRIALEPANWPIDWAAVEPLLDQRVRRNGRRYRPLAAKGRANVVQAVGLCAAARVWAAEQGVALPEAFSADLAEAFLRFLFRAEEGRGPITMRSAADYFQRVILFARRGALFTAKVEGRFTEIHTALVSEATDETPGKHAKIRRFLDQHGLADLLHAAHRCLEEAADLPAHGAAACRLRRKAVVFALLLNGVDRQGDLSTFRIGREIARTPEGDWTAEFRQAKTRGKKALGSYWPVTSRIIDAHVMADRPGWQMVDRLRELDGANLLGLEEGALSTYHPAVLLQEEFGISGHLVRSLVTDLVRTQAPDAAWAVQALLGHSSRWMQQAYRTDFRDTAALEKYHATIKTIARDA
ncbi:MULTISPECIES: hypothetical protein [Limimaricola]|jgi:hypothetical protein|uniref:Uncharacterized protein n=1 Tax=Limimaricola cinnabarinus TaxID=1125964 RepID=A0A2G1MC13_9RHOB|nr:MULTISPECIES: hypothetical protein [Limimaricola]MCZ4262785.1 hypothetical protein [Limimaricola sp. G21655-S1]PHP26275.1 hypothetical protein CJ301_17205 [Limimaricola cinnabarinus]